MTLEQLEEAIQQLPPDQFRRLADWLQEIDQDRWDEQLERDIRAGKLDALADEAIHDYQAGKYRTL